MVDGLIVLQPYADQIISGRKKIEYRKRIPPLKNFRTDIYLLTKGYILGIIQITNWTDHIHSHKRDSIGYVDWHIKVVEKFDKPKKYIHPNGAQVWVKNVRLA